MSSKPIIYFPVRTFCRELAAMTLLMAGGVVFAQGTNDVIPMPARHAEIAPLPVVPAIPGDFTDPARQASASPTPAASPAPTPAASPAPAATPTLEQKAIEDTEKSIAAPVTQAMEGAQLNTQQAAAEAVPTPTPSAMEQQYSPQELGLPDALTDEPYIPQDLLSPIPKPGTTVQGDTAKASEATLQKLRAAAKGTTAPEAAKKMTIEEAISYGLNHNPDVLNAIEQIRVSQGIYISVRAQIIPQLNAGSNYAYQQQKLVGQEVAPIEIPLNNGQTLNLGGRDAPQNRFWSIQLTGSQLLFDGGAAVNQIRSAKINEDAAYFSLRQTIDQIIAQIKAAFFQVILNRALIIAQEQSVALLESQLQDQINRFEAGTVPRFNVLQAEVALANAIPPLIQARNNLRISQYQLVKLLGMNYDMANPDEIPFNVTGTLDFVFREINSDESIRTALIRSPFLKAQRLNILSQAANVNVQIAGYLPRVTMNGGYEVQNDPINRDLTETLSGWFFGFQGSWNIFDGFETAGNVRQAKAQLMQSKINYDNSVRQIILTVQESISNLQEARETIDSQQASVEQATEALRLSRERLDAGAGTQLDVLNAQVALLQAQTTLLQARYTYIAALAAYDAALSLDTQWEETFKDPLARPEGRKFVQITAPERKQPDLPRVFKNQDPVKGIINNPDIKQVSLPLPKATPTPSPTPAPASKKKSP